MIMTALAMFCPNVLICFGGVRVTNLFISLRCALFVFVLCLVFPMLPVSLVCLCLSILD
jgi:hypothetical protein